ncbi:MAG: hypothetical protein E3J72_20570 [Planctomycetota bacterium]|nr:MAG: hypothetical protein E3J72_20570 [Planctomycetota bacterium]
MAESPEINIEQLLSDLESQKQLYSEMIGISTKMLDGLRSGDSDAAARALEAKQEILKSLDVLEARLGPVRAEWRKISEGLPDADRERVNKMMRGVQEVLGKLIETENEAQKEIQERRNQVADKLRGTRSKKNVNRAYGQPKPDSTRFLDEEA